MITICIITHTHTHSHTWWNESFQKDTSLLICTIIILIKENVIRSYYRFFPLKKVDKAWFTLWGNDELPMDAFNTLVDFMLDGLLVRGRFKVHGTPV